MANHSDPESCGVHREVHIEALTGETDRPAIEPRNQESGMPTLLSEAEGNTVHDDNRKSCTDPTRSENLCMSGSLLHGSSEISSVSGATGPDGAGKVNDRNPAIYADEKSDTPIVPKKPSNQGISPAERVEGRGVAKGNADESSASRTQSRNHDASMGLEGIREIARRNRKLQFTALLHHVTPSLLVESFYALRKQAAAGVDGVTWQKYEKLLYGRVRELHREIHIGAYRAQPSRRVFIPKADGKLRPLGIAALEDKIVQQAVATVLNAIYEQDFLGFSYGFRQGRGQHDALDALSEGIEGRKVNWILDADIRSFFDEIDHEWMLRFLEHRIADRRVLRLIRKWLTAGVLEDGHRVVSTRGTPQGAVISPWTQKATSSLSAKLNFVVLKPSLIYVARGNILMTNGAILSHRKGSAFECCFRSDCPGLQPCRRRRSSGRAVRLIAASSLSLPTRGAAYQASDGDSRADHPNYDQGAWRRGGQAACLRPDQRTDNRRDGGTCRVAFSRPGEPAWLSAADPALPCIWSTFLTACSHPS